MSASAAPSPNDASPPASSSSSSPPLPSLPSVVPLQCAARRVLLLVDRLTALELMAAKLTHQLLRSRAKLMASSQYQQHQSSQAAESAANMTEEDLNRETRMVRKARCLLVCLSACNGLPASTSTYTTAPLTALPSGGGAALQRPEEAERAGTAARRRTSRWQRQQQPPRRSSSSSSSWRRGNAKPCQSGTVESRVVCEETHERRERR